MKMMSPRAKFGLVFIFFFANIHVDYLVHIGNLVLMSFVLDVVTLYAVKTCFG